MILNIGSSSKQPHGPSMMLGNMRDLGVQRLLVSCLNHACRHDALLDVSPSRTWISGGRRRRPTMPTGGSNPTGSIPVK
jgi:hypothetical protein